MKKILLGIFIMFIFTLGVDAASEGGSVIELEGIKIISKTIVSHNGILEIEYELVPRDADVKEIIWSIIGLEEGITAEIIDGNKTDSSKGTIKIEFDNKIDDTVKVKIKAENKANNIKKELEVEVLDEETSLELETKTEEVEELIKSLPEEVNKENYKEVGELLEQIDSLFNNYKEVEDFIDGELIKKYEYIIKEYEEYNEKDGNTFNIIVIILLTISFIVGLFVIFKKEK